MNILTILEIVIALFLVVVIMLQNRGDNGGGMSFGIGAESFRSKRGLERFLFYATIVLGVLFASISILALVLK